ncbi:MAG: hypothetical protein ABIQ12_06330 [Opitutaceae bacterium]
MLTQNGKFGAPPDPGCLETREIPAIFLRLHTPRAQIALPYASLVKLSLKLDETALEISFVTHHVVISGKHLAEIYQSVAEAHAIVISVAPEDFSAEIQLPGQKALVRAIRIEPLDAAERRKR